MSCRRCGIQDLTEQEEENGVCWDCRRLERECYEPIDTSPHARQAFADREAKLVKQDKWPLAHWYTDSDFCRAYNGMCAAIDQLAALSAEIVKLREASGVASVILATRDDEIARLREAIEKFRNAFWHDEQTMCAEAEAMFKAAALAHPGGKDAKP